MVDVVRQICVKDYTHPYKGKDGGRLILKRGKQYTTTRPKFGMVTVFTRYWAQVPQRVFDGAALQKGEKG